MIFVFLYYYLYFILTENLQFIKKDKIFEI